MNTHPLPLLMWPKTCWLLCDDLLSSSLSAWLSYQLIACNIIAHVHQIALPAFIWPCDCAFIRQFIIRLLAMFGHFWAERLSARINSTWQQFYLAFWPRPLTAIFIWPCGQALSLQNWFPLGLTMNVDFIFLLLPHSYLKILFYSWWMLIFIFLTPPWGNISFAPHSGTHFSTMVATILPWLPWCHPACTKAYNRITKTIGLFCQMRVC